MRAWVEEVVARINHLELELTKVKSVDPDVASDCKSKLDEVKAGVGPPSYSLKVNMAWLLLHDVEEAIDDLEQNVQRLYLRAREHSRSELPSKVAEWEKEYAGFLTDNERRESSRHMIHLAHEAAAAKYPSQRKRQRGILSISGVLLLVAASVLFLQGLSAESFLPPPPGSALEGVLLVLFVMIFGIAGGLLSGLIALYLSPNPLDNTRWFDPKPALVFAKASLGAWTAFIGVAAVGTGVVVGVYASLESVLLLSIVFGYGQQAITKFLDERAGEMVDAKTKNTSEACR